MAVDELIRCLLRKYFLSKMSVIECKPFLRWAGGKRWLLPTIEEILGEHNISRYFEPFLGGGSVYFRINFEHAIISDVNPELIDTYIQVRDNLPEVIRQLSLFRNTEEDYYRLRNDVRSDDKTFSAARFIFLNQSSYNGLYRVNAQGIYNVPFGFRKNYNIDYDNLRLVQQKLSDTKIIHASFESIEKMIQKGDTLFLDPPYTVSHNRNGFIKYNQKLFTLEDQLKLSNLIDVIIDKEAHYILTNGAHKTVREIFYRKNSRMITLERHSLLGGKNSNRGVINEFLFTNLPERGGKKC